MSQVKPFINPLIEELEDENLKEILRRISNFHEEQNQLQDFIHLEIETTDAQSNLKVRHNLGFIPKDLIRTKLVGSGDITFNHNEFDKDYLDITTTGDVRWRGFVGTYIRDESRVADTDTETL